jgi:hypothetical protein
MKSTASEFKIEENEILRKAYQLLAYFLANEGIAKIADPNETNDPLKALDARFLFQETSTLLLEVAILFRTLDDQLNRSTDSEQLEYYSRKVKNTNERYGFDMFDKLSIRECCNKIIHATTFAPVIVEGLGIHTKDFAAFYGDDDKTIVWHHLSGNVRISGVHKKNEWVYLINIVEFVEALAYLLGNIKSSPRMAQ